MRSRASRLRACQVSRSNWTRFPREVRSTAVRPETSFSCRARSLGAPFPPLITFRAGAPDVFGFLEPVLAITMLRPSQPFLEEAQQARRHKTGIAARLVDGIAEPVMRRALHDAGPREKICLLQSQQKGIGLCAPVHQIILRADAEEYADVIVGEGCVIDGRGLEIAMWVFRGSCSQKVLDVVLARTLVLIALPHLDDVVDTVDADEGFHLRADVPMGIIGIAPFEDSAFASK